MSDFERRQFVITGEISPEDWELSLRFLGKLGVTAEAVTEPSSFASSADPQYETLAPGTIPYRLREITSYSQFLANEHLGEFWPEYRSSINKPGSKHECLCWGINMLAYPEPKGLGYHMSESQQQEYAYSLGIEIVSPRSIVGFSDKYAPSAYGLWDHEDYGDAVIQVDSFIDSVRHIATLPIREKPRSINGAALRFFLALADKLEAQLSDAATKNG